MGTYKVRQGECLTLIASQFGFTDPMTIYNHPTNADFRKLRPNPNVLYPDDILNIPSKELKELDCPTDAVHRFRLTRPKKKIHLVLLDPDGEPLKDLDYTAEIEGKAYQGQTDGEGAIRLDVSVRATSGTLSVAGATPFLFKIANLNPMTDVTDKAKSGMLERLRNLGYGPFPEDLHDALPEDIELAIAQFEFDSRMPVTGQISDDLLDKLGLAHGC